MSKLRRQLRNLGRPASGGFGFQRSRSNEPALQLLVAAEVGSGPEATAAIAAGAHVLVASAAAIADAVTVAGDRAVGVWLEAAAADAIAAATEAGADFVILDDGRTPAVALLRPHDDSRAPLGRVLILGDDRSEDRLRSASGLGADAVLVDGVDADLSVRDQLALRRISELTGAPLVIPTAVAPSAEALRTWRDAGAPIVLVPGDPATVRATVEAAEQVPAPRRTRDDRQALVPSLAPHVHDDDDDDDF
ncbi:MAG: hypothetical protein O3B31_01610 [Chloroflexi bacterium]|nr:hypothetical protein [Chloroflexota bacterium]